MPDQKAFALALLNGELEGTVTDQVEAMRRGQPEPEATVEAADADEEIALRREEFTLVRHGNSVGNAPSDRDVRAFENDFPTMPYGVQQAVVLDSHAIVPQAKVGVGHDGEDRTDARFHRTGLEVIAQLTQDKLSRQPVCTAEPDDEDDDEDELDEEIHFLHADALAMAGLLDDRLPDALGCRNREEMFTLLGIYCN